MSSRNLIAVLLHCWKCDHFKTIMTRFIAILILVFSTQLAYGQSITANTKKIEAVNEYANFLNESMHGMLIVHRLLENYNQELNKYVDLDSYVINNFSNADLPANIFEDPDAWFYDVSPLSWNTKAASNAALSPSEKAELQSSTSSIIATISQINQIRFDVEKLIATLDLTQRSELARVYEKLEEGVTLYEDFYQKEEQLATKLKMIYSTIKPTENQQYAELHKIFNKLHLSTRLALQAIRSKEDEQVPRYIADLEDGIASLKSFDFAGANSTKLNSSKGKRAIKDIIERATAAATKMKTFYNDGTLPKEFVNHGRYYFYYNSDIINVFNRYGNGFVFEMNRLSEYLDMPVMKFLELPHYYKVIYPKVISANEPLASTNPNIKDTPRNLKSREIIPTAAIIEVDSLVFHVAVFDSKINDGDVISFNYNKDWLLQEERLTDVPVHFNLKINESGKNFFILHADDMGRNPPTTIGIRYSYGGEKQTVKLSSNLNQSQMIEVRYRPVKE